MSEDNAKILKAVQTCRKEVPQLKDDATWRDFLAKHADGQTSTRAMDRAQLTRVLKALYAAGAPEVTVPKRARATRLADGEQDKLLRHLWLALWEAGAVDDPGEPALLSYVRARTGVEMLEWVKAGAKRGLIEQLKAWLARSADDPVCPIRLSVRDKATGLTDHKALCAALWTALAKSGGMRMGIHAREDTWLHGQGYRVSHWTFLTDGEAREAAGKLSTWLRRVVKQGEV